MSKKSDVPDNIQKSMRSILNYCNVYKAEQNALGDLDLDESPARITHMWKHELLASYQPGAYEDLVERFTMFPLPKEAGQEMIVQRGISFTSVCAHHMLPFHGTCSIGYIPSKKLVGLSKFSRVVEYYSRQLQLHERLTSQIADFIDKQLKPQAVIVRMDAEHLCMSIRGVKQPGAVTAAVALRGDAHKAHIKQEFYQLLKLV